MAVDTRAAHAHDRDVQPDICDQCGSYMEDRDNHDCPAAKAEEAKVEDAAQVGDRAVLRSYDGSTYRGTILAMDDMDEDVAIRMWGVGIEQARRHAGNYVAGITAEEAATLPVLSVLLRQRDTYPRRNGMSIEQVMREHPGFLNRDMTVGELFDQWKVDEGEVLRVHHGIVKVTKAKPLPQLRPCDGLVLLGAVNGDPGDGGEQGEIPKGHRKNYDEAAFVLCPDKDNPANLMIWCPTNGDYLSMNPEDTKFHRMFKATDKNWCAARRGPVLALASYMRNEFEKAQQEERVGVAA